MVPPAPIPTVTLQRPVHISAKHANGGDPFVMLMCVLRWWYKKYLSTWSGMIVTISGHTPSAKVVPENQITVPCEIRCDRIEHLTKGRRINREMCFEELHAIGLLGHILVI